MCAVCRSLLRPLTAPRCARCGAPTAWAVERCRECAGRRLAFSSSRAAVAYAGPARPLLRAWKERGLRRVANLAAELVVAHIERPEADVITYIPPDPIRQLKRPGHPAPALAHELATRWEIECVSLLERTRSSGRQAALPLAARRSNVRNVFAARRLTDGCVLLVDDVYTTGSTLSAAATALRRAGAEAVEGVTFARTMR